MNNPDEQSNNDRPAESAAVCPLCVGDTILTTNYPPHYRRPIVGHIYEVTCVERNYIGILPVKGLPYGGGSTDYYDWRGGWYRKLDRSEVETEMRRIWSDEVKKRCALNRASQGQPKTA